MVLVENQFNKGSLPAIYRPAAVRAVLVLFLASLLPTPWVALTMPRTSTSQLGPSILDFLIGIPLGLIALCLAWRLFRAAIPGALNRGTGFASLHAAFILLVLPAAGLSIVWLPLVRWSLLGGYFLGAAGGFFVLLLAWVSGLPDSSEL